MAKSRGNPEEPNPVRSLSTPPTASGDLMKSEAVKRYWCTFDMTTDEGRMSYLRLKNNKSHTSDEFVGKEFAITNALAHEAESTDPADGEVSTFIRVVLQMDSGETVAFGSNGVWSTLLDVVTAFGQPPWRPPINVRLVQRKTRHGFNTLLLEVVGR